MFIALWGCGDKSEPSVSPFRVIGYFSGPTHMVDSFEVEKLTHLIYCFGHLKGNRLDIGSAQDSATIQKMVGLKSKNPDLKVLLSLGGWTGCEPCSDVFNTIEGRKEFAASLKELSDYFKTDGFDLDWEYPVIPGPPGHPYRDEDRDNVTLLMKEIRQACGDDFETSIAAGGFTTFIEQSLDWPEVMKYTDFINLMTYDLIHGYSRISGHHTPLYSTPQQTESTDHAVQLLIQKGVPRDQIIIGAVMYGRFFQMEVDSLVDLNAPCHFLYGFPYKRMQDSLATERGFVIKWDSIAQAPYAINEDRNILATYDDKRSMALKTQYAMDQGLGGIMFWQLCDDKPKGGLLDVIYENVLSRR
jgi:chitinase